MDSRTLKQLTGDAASSAAQYWNDAADTDREQFLSLAAQYQHTLQVLRSCQRDKKDCARAFRDDDADQPLLRERMREISAGIGRVEQQLRDIGESIARLIDRATRADTPEKQPFMRWQHGATAAADHDVIVDCAAAAPADWNTYLEHHPAGNFCLRSDLCRLVADIGGHRAHYFLARKVTGELCGVLPIVEMQSALFGHFAVSVPWFNYGGALADTAAIEAQLIDAARRLLDDGCAHVELRDTRERASLPARTDKVSMILPLPDASDILLAGFPAKLRAQIKRGERENLTYRSGGSALLPDFYRVFSIHMRDLGTPVYPARLFGQLLEHFADECSLHLLYRHNRPVAAAFLIRDGDVMQIPWAATLRRAHGLSANMSLYWRVLDYSIAQGCAWFDFGRSTRNAGTYRFKRQWGAEPVQHHWHYCLPENNALPALNPDNPKFRLLIAVWQRLPVWLTRLLGPPIVVNIP